MLQKIRKAAELTLSEWATVLSASFWLIVADLALRRHGLRHVQALLIPRQPAHAGPLPGPTGLQTIERLCYLVDIAVHHHLYRMACLPRSLVLQRLLAQRGVPTNLRIGVRKAGGQLVAHAWVEYEGQPLCDAHDVEVRFLPLRAQGR